MSGSQKEKEWPKTATPKKGASTESGESSEKQLVLKSAEKANKKRKSEACHDGEEALIDQAIEEKLQEVARKNNLSQIEMKRILRKLVGNEHVLALVKIQEEELENQEELESSSEKFTRAKARALNQKPIPLPPLNDIEPEPEVAALISQDLHSDEEDEEYHPHDEDLVSDDDPNGTISDIDSQPATPNYPTTPQKDDTPVHYSQDGLFKVPRDRCDSLCSQSSQQEEIIAKRTRSKLCLQTTPIEAIESTFVPPDITTDMYDLDADMDHAWMEFLNEFTKPLNTTATVEEDDEADPEYVAADKVPIDREELRDVNISKKELSDLIAELFDGLVSSESINEEDDTLHTPKKTWDKPNDKSPIRKKQKVNEAPCDTNQQSNTNNSYSLDESNVLLSANTTEFDPNIMSTPQPGYKFSQKTESTNVNDQRNDLEPVPNYQQLNQPLNFAPTSLPLQTPLITSHSNSSLSQGSGIFPPPSAQTYIVPTSHSTLQLLPLQGPHAGTFLAFPVGGSVNPIPAIPCQLSIPINNSTNSPFITLPMNYNRGTPQIVETIDITQSPERDSCASMSALSPKSNNQQLEPTLKASSSYPEPALPQSTATESCAGSKIKKKKRQSSYSNLCFYQYEKWRNDVYVSINKYMRTEYAQKYEALKYETSEAPQFNEDQKGFTDFQLCLLQQQMQMFVQFATQNFFQTYSHPELWKLAGGQKDLLLNLKKKLEEIDSVKFYPSNLKCGIKLIKEWEEELSVNSKENREMMDFLYEEIDKVKAHSSNYASIMRFHPRVMKRLLNSPVVLYPDMLPKIPFRFNVLIPYHEFAPTEDFLIALGMERYFTQIEEEEAKNPRYKTKVSRMRVVCERIARDITVGKTPRRILSRINIQMQSDHYNPIKFYNERKRAPPVKHELRPVNSDNPQLPVERISELPLVWKEFATDPQDASPENGNSDLRPEETIAELREEIPKAIREARISSTLNNTSNQSGNNSITSANIVIHFNYRFDNVGSSPLKSFQVLGDPISGTSKQNSVSDVVLRHLESIGPLVNNAISNSGRSVVDVGEIINSLKYSQGKDTSSGECSGKTLNVDDTILPQVCLKIESAEHPKGSPNLPKGQKRLTDYFSLDSVSPSKSLSDEVENFEETKLRKRRIKFSRLKLSKFTTKRRRPNRNWCIEKTRRLKIKLCFLVRCYYKKLRQIRCKYGNEHLNYVHVYFKSLDLYTGLLSKLKMNCKKAKCSMGNDDISAKRAKLNNEVPNTSKNRKSVRTNEYLKRMVTPESQEEVNKKDAIYALNFYDKVEETLKKDGKFEIFKKFQNILKSFDPQKDQISEIYNKIEKIFLPDYPQFAEIFLTFLLPGEAAQVGKFFEHFILSNMTTFINKLNLYFSKQPAQIKKVYSALDELSEDSDVTMDKIKEKILPLLKGNQFLTDWFLQNFSSEMPPERLTSIPENINYKALEIPRTGERECEHIPSDELVSDANNDTRCQLKYLNGRIFYGSKILLPAKLAFLADDASQDFEECSDSDEEDNRLKETTKMCAHGIRDFAEKCLKGAADASDEPEKFMVDPEVPETSTKYVVCDNAALKAHAIRLNPSLYASEKERRTSSPKKSLKINLTISCKDKEKRKSPKKNIKSPCSKRSPNGQSGCSLDPTSKAIGTAKRLKSLIDGSDSDDQNRPTKHKTDDKSTNEEDGEEDADDVEIEENSSDSDDAQKSYGDPMVMVEIKTSPWTRDEDKIILEEVKCGFDNEEILIKKLCENLPHRTESEIIHRHQFLMDVLSQLQSRG